MLSREEHAALRAGKVTGSVAHVVYRGSMKAWKSLASAIFADDGVAFAAIVGGARGFGHEQEPIGVGRFFERHSEYEIEPITWLDYRGDDDDLLGRIGTSPDRLLSVEDPSFSDRRLLAAGLEIKSPTTAEKMDEYLSQGLQESTSLLRRSKPYAQIQHGLLVSGLPVWWLVVHHGKEYRELRIEPDDVFLKSYLPRLHQFIDFMESGKRKTRKLTASDL